MKNKLKYLLQAFCLLTCLMLGLVYGKYNFSRKPTSNNGTKNPDTSITIIQYIDSSTHLIQQVSPIVYKNQKVLKLAKIDTQSIISQYFTKRVTQNTYLDSNLSISVFDTLYQNSILGRSLNYKILRPSTQITKTISQKQKGLYVGASYFPSSGVYPNVSYAFKNWQIGAGIVNLNKQTIPFFNLQYKIR